MTKKIPGHTHHFTKHYKTIISFLILFVCRPRQAEYAIIEVGIDINIHAFSAMNGHKYGYFD